MKRKIYLTKQNLLEMQIELDYLTKFCGPKIEKLLDRARSLDRLNWGCIKNEYILIKKRIVELTTTIKNATITKDTESKLERQLKRQSQTRSSSTRLKAQSTATQTCAKY